MENQQHYTNTKLVGTKTTTTKVKLLLSYGGKIQVRPSDHHQLCYLGGDTKILALDRNVKFSEVVSKLKTLCNCNGEDDVVFSVKYQLPGFDLDALVSLTDDDDVEHMMVEYDRMQRITVDDNRPGRLRLFVFVASAPKQAPSPSPNPDYLFGFDKEYQHSAGCGVAINGPPLDLLQIPGVFAAEGRVSVVSPAMYRLPTVGGDWQQPVYPVKVMVDPVGNYVNGGVEGKAGQVNF